MKKMLILMAVGLACSLFGGCSSTIRAIKGKSQYQGNRPFASTPESVLFIGNSFTYYNKLPSMLEAIAEANGEKLITAAAVKGGASLYEHSSRQETLEILKSRKWDVVVLQGQSIEPIFEMEKMIKGAETMALVCGDARPMVFMTWAYKSEKCFLNKSKPALGNGFTAQQLSAMYPKMQDSLEDGYRKVAEDINANIAPVGLAWKAARKKHPEWELFVKDEYHPSPLGTYLSALVFYRILYGTLPEIAPENMPEANDFKIDKTIHEEMKKIVQGL